uniref:Piezo TM1-24 domain-containing protein n=1 Tax=Knipowitschia caucasica TaxID=637954 RepID=A0AAV2LVL5_KNICA
MRTSSLRSLRSLCVKCVSGSGPWEDVLFHIGVVRFSQVGAADVVRYLAPDLGLLVSSLFVLRLLKKLLRPVPMSLHDNGITHPQETSDTESEDTESEDSESEDSSEDTAPPQSGPPQFVQKFLVFAAGLRLLLSTVMNTAGKVVVTVLLGLTGIVLPSLTSSWYFCWFLLLVWLWIFSRPLSLLLFTSLCVMMSIFSGFHLLLLYLYQLPLPQKVVPPQDLYARLFGMTGVIRTDPLRPYSLKLHAEVCWPDFINPLVVLLLYYTLVALLHKWVHVPTEDLDEAAEESPVESPDLPPSFSRVIYITGDQQEYHPGPVGVDPDMLQYHPGPVGVDPDMLQYHPGPVGVDPDMLQYHPGPVGVDPDMLQYHPGPVGVDPDMLQYHPGPVGVDPDMLQYHPGPVGVDPDMLQYHPGPVGVDPDMLQYHPGPVGVDSDMLQYHPGPVGVDPDMLQYHPGPVGVDPE